MLSKNPAKRPGAKSFSDLKNDPFFNDIDWIKLGNKELDPPTMLSLKPRTEEESAMVGALDY